VLGKRTENTGSPDRRDVVISNARRKIPSFNYKYNKKVDFMYSPTNFY